MSTGYVSKEPQRRICPWCDLEVLAVDPFVRDTGSDPWSYWHGVCYDWTENPWPRAGRLTAARRQWFKWPVAVKLTTLPLLRRLVRLQDEWTKDVAVRGHDKIDEADEVWWQLWRAIYDVPEADKLRSRWG